MYGGDGMKNIAGFSRIQCKTFSANATAKFFKGGVRFPEILYHGLSVQVCRRLDEPAAGNIKNKEVVKLPLPQEKVYTINDIYTLPDGERAEIIDGQIYYMAPPNTKHQRISGMLHTKISNYIGSRRGRCEVFAAPFAVFLNQDDKNYVEPDISVVCVPDKLDERGCNGAPDWIIEIVSQSSRRICF